MLFIERNPHRAFYKKKKRAENSAPGGPPGPGKPETNQPHANPRLALGPTLMWPTRQWPNSPCRSPVTCSHARGKYEAHGGGGRSSEACASRSPDLHLTSSSASLRFRDPRRGGERRMPAMACGARAGAAFPSPRPARAPWPPGRFRALVPAPPALRLGLLRLPPPMASTIDSPGSSSDFAKRMERAWLISQVRSSWEFACRFDACYFTYAFCSEIVFRMIALGGFHHVDLASSTWNWPRCSIVMRIGCNSPSLPEFGFNVCTTERKLCGIIARKYTELDIQTVETYLYRTINSKRFIPPGIICFVDGEFCSWET